MEEQRSKAMIKYFFNPPSIIKKIYSEYYWNTKSQNILLTFDDGPTTETSEIILKILDEANIQALFFCVGNNVDKNPSVCDEMLSAGHIIGNHTYNHKIFTKNELPVMENEILRTNNLLLEKFNYTVKYFRPPHGRFNKNMQSMLDKNKLKNVMWSLLTYDYKSDRNIVKFAVKKYLVSNSIIVFHDSLKSKKIIEQALKFTIDFVESNNYKFGKVDECLN